MTFFMPSIQSVACSSVSCMVKNQHAALVAGKAPVCQPFCPLDLAFLNFNCIASTLKKSMLTWKQWEGTICVWEGWSPGWEWYQVLIQGIEGAYEMRGGSAKRIGSGAVNCVITRKFKLCLAKLCESLNLTAVLAAPLAFVLPAGTQLPGLGIPTCSASPLPPPSRCKKLLTALGKQRENGRNLRKNELVLPLVLWRTWKCGVFSSHLCCLCVISVTWENLLYHPPLRSDACPDLLKKFVGNSPKCKRGMCSRSRMWSAETLALFR